MFENLTEKFERAFKVLKGQGQISEINVAETLKEVRRALLDADVNFKTAKKFTNSVKEKAIGAEVLKSVSPGQAIIKIVQDELTELMGEENAKLDFSTKPPAIILLAGLQGSGKTTTAGKLGKILTEQKKKVLLVSADVYRPAAIDQLKTLAESLSIECFDSTPKDKPNAIATASMAYAKKHFFDVVIFDTAGRLGIDDAMMKEIKLLHKTLTPIETLFVVDAMQGQDAVNTAKAFGDTLPLTGIILTKLDGDSRGGAALSVRHITGQPIKFIGVSEKTSGLEPFYPDRMASRILGMGDIVGLVEEAQKNVDIKEAEKLANKVKSGKSFDLDDFKNQIAQMKKMGGMGAMMDKMPKELMNAANNVDPEEGNKSLNQTEAIINSMTKLERQKPEVIKAKRKIRIAAGSGVQVQDVNRLLKQFEEMQKMMKMFSKGGIGKLMRGLGGRLPGIR